MPSPKKSTKTTPTSKVAGIPKLTRSQQYMLGGALLLIVGIVVLGATYIPMLWATAQYYLSPQQHAEVVAERPTQVDTQKDYLFAKSPEFGIVIPKIHANTRVIANVDPFNPAVYQQELSKGVAHATGTALPDQDGMSFFFAHSAGDISKARQYNAVFYLLDKLTEGDEIYVFYKRQKYKYLVTKQEIVNPDQVEFLHSKGNERTLTLMTCTPAGTTRQRLLVHAKLVPNQE